MVQVKKANQVEKTAVKPVRRSQEERSASMARAILDAAVACILEFGVAGAPVDKIARRANATGGSVQHHFGTRDGLLLRVVDDFGDRLRSASDALTLEGESVAHRVEAVCNTSWNIVSSAHYLVVIQIFLAVQENEPLYAQIFERLKSYESDLDALWIRIFKGSGIENSRIVTVRHVAMATFRGLAVRMIYRNDRTRWASELRMLKTMVSTALVDQADCL